MLKALKSAAKAAGLRRPRRRWPTSYFARPLSEVTERGDDPCSTLFYGYSGDAMIHKWGHYLPIYSRLLAPFREGINGRPLRFLEIGVSYGGSMDLWRAYFGPEATIFGIDIDPRCAAFNGRSAQVRIGSQDDPDFLRDTVREMGGVDVVLDDGSHIARHQRRSFDVLFPLLTDGGLYLVEDLHTSYWPQFGGGLRRPGTFIEVGKSLVDDMHAWYHRAKVPAHSIGSIQFFDSIMAIEKRPVSRPFHTKVGHEDSITL